MKIKNVGGKWRVGWRWSKVMNVKRDSDRSKHGDTSLKERGNKQLDIDSGERDMGVKAKI